MLHFIIFIIINFESTAGQCTFLNFFYDNLDCVSFCFVLPANTTISSLQVSSYYISWVLFFYSWVLFFYSWVLFFLGTILLLLHLLSSTISSLHLLVGLFLQCLLFLGHHSIDLLHYLLSSFLAICSIHFHFCYLITSIISLTLV